MNIIEQLVNLEKIILNPAIRQSPERMQELLAPDFVEVGHKGDYWQRAQLINALQFEQNWSAHIQDIEHREVTHEVHQLIYRAFIHPDGQDEYYSRRTSVWRWNGETWQMVFHQGTPIEPFELIDAD
ncbi:nuclear transport factor 2 family protein [Celerinatantimonas yamalensis]|uniref:DUF4440 domain-containing protein n=1 Tax=Celerinatantimonas yamalensis TaxID=559956 RepID=A0ABW9G2H6_9GAMM